MTYIKVVNVGSNRHIKSYQLLSENHVSGGISLKVFNLLDVQCVGPVYCDHNYRWALINWSRKLDGHYPGLSV